MYDEIKCRLHIHVSVLLLLGSPKMKISFWLEVKTQIGSSKNPNIQFFGRTDVFCIALK